MGCKKVAEGVEIDNRVWGEGGEPFKDRAFEGGGEGLVEDDIKRCVEGNMCDVHLKMFVRVGVSRIAVQCEGFPLVGERCGCDVINEKVAMFGWVWWKRVWRDGMTDDGRERGGVVVRRDMSGGKGGSTVVGCRLFGDGGWMMDDCVVGGDDGCLLSGGEDV